jgi:DNA-binding transcriptional MocR family regulator
MSFAGRWSKGSGSELNSLSKLLIWQVGVGMVLGNAACIDAILKVKSNMDSGMFWNQKGR